MGAIVKSLLKNQRWAAATIGPAAVLVFLLAAGAPRAMADSIITYAVGAPISALSPYTGPYATVEVDLTSSTTATITFTSLTNGGNIYLLGDGGTADLNVNGSYTLGTVTESSSISGFGATYKNNTPGNVSSFGVFNLSLNNKGGFKGSATSVIFTLTNTGGTWTSASDVLVANADGNVVAVHAFVCAEPGCSTSSNATLTGFATVPEPASAALLALGLLVLIALGAYRRGLAA